MMWWLRAGWVVVVEMLVLLSGGEMLRKAVAEAGGMDGLGRQG